MAEEALNFLLQDVQKLVVEHYHLVSKAGNELRLLEAEVKSMSAFLKELGEQPQARRGELLKQYEREVRDVAHEAQDVLDECLTRAALENSNKWRRTKQMVRFFNPKFINSADQVKSFRRDTIKPLFEKYAIGRNTSPLPLPLPPPQISHSITTPPYHHQITLPMEENGIATSSTQTPTNSLNQELPMEDNGIATSSTQTPTNSLNQELPMEHNGITTSSTPTPTNSLNQELEHEITPRRGTIVGFKKEADNIIEFLSDESYKQLEVISIIGMPGLGKTTLARKIYQDKRITDQFPKLIWVDVSQNYEKRKVFLSILESLTTEDTSKLADDKLASTIKVSLQSQKFLLFLDDVWNAKHWKDIEAALPKANKLGRVLITSRHRNVAVTAKFTRDPYNLRILDPRESWELLQLEVFDNLNICPPELDPLGKIIAGECGGVPLAIVVVGGVLLKKYSTSTGVNETRVEWQKVSNNVRKYLNDEESRTRNLIALSYNELSLDLRYCFLYLGIFPEESQIPVRRLIRMWIAEGFISRKQDKSLEEVAHDNLKDLIDRNLVMVDNTKPDGYIKTCRVHDMIREFCKFEASLENHNLFHEMEIPTGQGSFDPPVAEIQNRRRICIHSHIEDFLKKQPKGPRVHSFLCFAKDAIASLPAETPPIPVNFNRLRVVDANPIKLTKFPSNLFELLHLRYISLSGDGDDFRVLPKAISNLWNLQSITIETKLQTFEINANVWKMEHLRHLKTKAAIILENKSKGTGGEQLQSLSRLSAKCCTEGVLDRAKNLKNLGIRGDLAYILEVDCFREMHLLQKLKLVYDVSPRVASERPLPRLPNPDLFPTSLRILQLSGTFLPWNQIRKLEKLPALEVLKLKSNAFEGKYWPAVDACFPTLEILFIADTNLVVWTATKSYFPELRCLVLKDCTKLEKIPFQLKEKLQRLHVERVSESAVESAKKIAEEKDKAQGRGSAERIGFKLTIGSEGKL